MTGMRPSGGRRTPAGRFNPPCLAFPGLLAASALLVSGMLLSCAQKDGDLAGSEIGNPTVAVSGTALYPDGSVAGGARVTLRRTDYLAEDKGFKLLSSTASVGLAKISVSLANVFTDSKGYFRIDSVDAGAYRIEINDDQNQGVLIDCAVKGKKDTALPTESLRATGTVHGVVKWDSPPTSPYLALVYGLERVALVDGSNGHFTMNDLPPGNYTFKVGCLGRGCLSKDVENIHVTAGSDTTLDTVSIASFVAEDYSKWGKSAKVEINTSASGADVAEDLYDFPLLVRLDASNFDFSQAEGRGRDIRFAGSAGQHLHYDIERWDSLERKAEIWVRVDTVHASNATQSLTLYWGNPLAAFYTGGTQVFAASEGFRGVWHLGEEGSSTPNGFRDASGHGNHGTGQGISPVSSHTSVAGQGLNFDGTTAVTVNPDSSLHSKDSLTLEFWVNFAALGPFKRIVSKAYFTPATPWSEYDIETNSTGTMLAFSVALGGSLSSVRSTTKPVLGTWYHVAGTYDGEILRMYVNGVEEAVTVKSGVITDYGRGLTFGKYEYDDVSNFRGKLDEVRVSGKTRSAAWLKLSYENQRTGSAIPSIKP
ncbi:MAG: putative protein of unknown function acetylesterase [Fibrobacteres bacterium]|nr:putative protein of unknown function acetylesterase [Fibrobacterota bacterium]